MNVSRALKTASGTLDRLFRDRGLAETVVYQRLTGSDYDPASQNAAETREERTIPVIQEEYSAGPEIAGWKSRERRLLIRAADLDAPPASGDRISGRDGLWLVEKAEKEAGGLAWLVSIRRI